MDATVADNYCPGECGQMESDCECSNTAPLPMRIMRASLSDAPAPSYAHNGDAGLDLRAATHGSLRLDAGQRVKIPTGWAIELPPGHVGLVLPRSGLQDREGVAAGVGVIDGTYRGEISVTMFNHSSEPYWIHPGDKIAQLVVLPVATVTCVVVDALSKSARGGNGYGSTGR